MVSWNNWHTFSQALACFQVHKSDFIIHLKQSNMIHAFESADPESDFHWKKKADLAFR